MELVVNGLVLLAWGFFVWGFRKFKQSYKPEHMKDRNFQVKTFWVLFSGGILWSLVGAANLFDGKPFLFEGFFTVALGESAYILNKKVRALRRT